jgi:two-component system, cell cycle sensor histidine kinase and response regulator CckA
MTGKKILILEDDEIVSEITAEILSLEGYEVTCSANGEETVTLYEAALLSGNPFDVVFMDLNIMDGMGGCDTMKELLKLNPNLKGIVSSGFHDDPVMTHYAEYGFTTAISKPYTSKELIKKVERTLKSD